VKADGNEQHVAAATCRRYNLSALIFYSTLALKAQNAKVKFICYNSPHFTPNSTPFV
jgi:hypothetical protein